jgi:CcmD family protein
MGRRLSFVKALVVLALIVMGGVALAAFQDSGFVPVKPGETGQETLPATPLVFVAYGFVWTVLLVYVFFLWRKLGRVERELSEVSAKLRSGNQP